MTRPPAMGAALGPLPGPGSAASLLAATGAQAAPLTVEETLGLMRAWESGSVPPPPRSRVVDLMDFAARHRIAWSVGQALARALPPAAAQLLLHPALAAGEARAAALARQLRQASARLNTAGLEPMAAEGAAAIADAAGAPAPWREMSGLDLLIAPDRLSRAVAALLEAGYAADPAAPGEADPRRVALSPPPGSGGATLRLHGRPGLADRGPLRDAARRAQPSALPGLRVPAPEDRLLRLFERSQAGDRRQALRLAQLRGALDWRMLTRDGAVDLEAVARRLPPGRRREAFEAVATLMGRIWAESAPDAWVLRHAGRAEEALAALAGPDAAGRRPAEARRRAPTARETLAARLAGALDPARLRRLLRRT